jgi:uncharacterized protein YcsI (UPF0317 family)
MRWPTEVRAAMRAGNWHGSTRDLAPGYVQCNVVMLPEAWAGGFAGWCAANPRVAPILARSEPGDPGLPSLGTDIDIRTDLARYCVLRDGIPAGEVHDIRELWTDDLVTFAFGCSFSLEDALRREGVPLRYEQRGFGGAIYETSVPTVEHASFAAPLIVSMRPLPAEAVGAALTVSERYPQLHGLPVHAGDPAKIGVDLARPLDVIGTVAIAEGEVPVFWACGVTTQAAIKHARPPLAFAHVSSRMLVCDLRLEDLGAG